MWSHDSNNRGYKKYDALRLHYTPQTFCTCYFRAMGKKICCLNQDKVINTNVYIEHKNLSMKGTKHAFL